MPEIFDAKKNAKPTRSKKKQAKKHQAAAKSHHHKKSAKPRSRKHGPTKHVDEYSEVLKHEKTENNHLKAYIPKPKKVCFDTQLGEEQVVLLLRAHPVAYTKKLVIIFIAALLPLLFFATPMLSFMALRFKFAALISWYLLLIGFTLETFLVWFFNVYIVTDERIIDVDFLSLIFKNISSAKIENIEDITIVSGGFMASMVNYGTILIQTAGEKREFDFSDVPKPAKVTAILNEMMLEEEREKLEGRVN